jgi:hypothetical protein
MDLLHLMAGSRQLFLQRWQPSEEKVNDREN